MAKLDSGAVIWDDKTSDFFESRWLDSQVVGSGRVGASLTGAISNEAIVINMSGLRDGGKTSVLQDISDKFPQIRKHYTDGKVFDAASVLEREFNKKGYSPMGDYQVPVCSLNLDFQVNEFPLDYRRMLDMENAEASVTFRTDTVVHERHLFVSRTTDMVVFNAKGKVNLVATIENAKAEGNFLLFSSRLTNGTEFGIVARIIVGGGSVMARASGFAITDADNVMILAKPFIGNPEVEFNKLKRELDGVKLTYSKLQSQNEAIHKRLFNKIRLELGNKTTSSQRALMNDVFRGNLCPTLIERLWNFAKYLSICCDELSPYGLWLGDKGCEYSLWNNTAQLLLGGLTINSNSDAILGLLEHFERFSDDLRKNSSRVFGMTGYVVPDKIAPGSALFGSAQASTLHFVASSALAANLFYSYFLATGDTKTLKSRIFPFMRQVAEFYGDFLKLDNYGKYTTMPSYSPSSTPGNTIQGKKLENFHFATNSTIDFLAVEALLDGLINAGEILGDNDDVELWNEMKSKLPNLQANENGGIREWTNSPFVDGKLVRGNLHCYGLYPLKTLSFNDYEVAYQPKVATGTNPSISLKNASVNSVKERMTNAGSVQDAKTLGMSAIQMAHSQSPELARDMITRLLSSVFTNSGLSLSNDWRGGGFSENARPYLDICGNFGFANAITECLIQSNTKTLRILPTAFAELKVGEVNDFATDFGAKVSMAWNIDNGRLNLKITPRHNCKVDIEFNPAFKKPKSREKFDNNKMLNVELIAGKTTVIEF